MREQLFLVHADPILRRMRRMRWPVLVGAALGLAGGLAVHNATPPTWTAQVAVELPLVRDRVDLNPVGIRGDALSIDTDAQLVLSDPVVDAVARADGRTPREVSGSLRVTARPLSRILLISYDSGTPEGAMTGARQAGTVFLRERDRAYLAPQRAYLDGIARDTASVTPDFDEVLAATGVPSSENLRRAGFVRSLTLPDAGQVVAGPRLTAEVDRGDLEVPLMTGAGAGAIAGVALVLVLDLTRRRPVAAPRPAPGGRRRARPPSLRRVMAGSLVIVVVTTAVVGTAAVLVTPQRWTASALVYVPPMPGNAHAGRGGANATGTDLGTEAELARADRVLGAVAESPEVEATVEQLRSRIRTVASRRGETVEIVVTGSSAAGAEREAALVAQEFVVARRERALSWISQRKTALDAATAGAEQALDSALGPAGDTELVNAYNRRVTELRVDSRRNDQDAVAQGAVLSTRSAPDGRSRMLVLGVTAVAFLLGVVVAIGTRGATRVPFSVYRR